MVKQLYDGHEVGEGAHIEEHGDLPTDEAQFGVEGADLTADKDSVPRVWVEQDTVSRLIISHHIRAPWKLDLDAHIAPRDEVEGAKSGTCDSDF